MLTRRAFGTLAVAAPMVALAQLGGGAHDLTILYTNNFHSAFEPVPGFWLRGSPRLGGAAHLATLIERERAAARGRVPARLGGHTLQRGHVVARDAVLSTVVADHIQKAGRVHPPEEAASWR